MERVKGIEALKAELVEMANNIKSNITKAEEEINLMRNQSPTDEGDYAVLLNDSAIDDTLIAKQMKKLEEIELALDKIANGDYGICEMCEDEIDIERLKVKPFAKFCISCREINEKEVTNR
jgi:DnaK suppressor protein